MSPDISQNQFEWLIIILVYNNSYYDEDFKGVPGYVTMEAQKNSMFRAIKDSVPSSEIKVILVETRFYNSKIVTNVVEKKGNKLETIERPEDGDEPSTMATEGSVESLLKIVLNQFKAKRHIVVTFGHGSIFGINFTSTSTKDLSIQRSYFDFNKQQQEYFDGIPVEDYPEEKAWFKGSSKILEKEFEELKTTKFAEFDLGNDVSVALLTNQELAQSIKAVFKSKKVDVLVMYNCLMQNVNTQYDLRQAVDYLVAPESGICHPGYNYRGVLNELANDVKMDNKTVAGLFCDKEIVRGHRRYKLFETDIENTWYINSIQLDERKYDELKKRFTAFIDEILNLKRNNDQIFRSLNDTINQIFGYSHYCIPDAKVVDMHVFLTQLRKKASNNQDIQGILRPIDELIEVLSSIDNEFFCGRDFYPFDQFYVDQELNVKKGFGFFIPRKPTKKLLFDKLFEGTILPYMPGIWENTSYVKFVQEFQQWNGDFI